MGVVVGVVDRVEHPTAAHLLLLWDHPVDRVDRWVGVVPLACPQEAQPGVAGEPKPLLVVGGVGHVGVLVVGDAIVGCFVQEIALVGALTRALSVELCPRAAVGQTVQVVVLRVVAVVVLEFPAAVPVVGVRVVVVVAFVRGRVDKVPHIHLIHQDGLLPQRHPDLTYLEVAVLVLGEGLTGLPDRQNLPHDAPWSGIPPRRPKVGSGGGLTVGSDGVRGRRARDVTADEVTRDVITRSPLHAV